MTLKDGWPVVKIVTTVLQIEVTLSGQILAFTWQTENSEQQREICNLWTRIIFIKHVKDANAKGRKWARRQYKDIQSAHFQKLTAEIKNDIFQYGPGLIESMSDFGTGQTRPQRKPTAQRSKTTHQLPEEPNKEIENGPIFLEIFIKWQEIDPVTPVCNDGKGSKIVDYIKAALSKCTHHVKRKNN